MLVLGPLTHIICNSSVCNVFYSFHRINKSNIDKVFVCGKYIKETFNYLSTNKKGKVFKNIKEAHVHFSKILHNNDLLMIKGSNATGLNRFSKNIKRGQISAI